MTVRIFHSRIDGGHFASFASIQCGQKDVEFMLLRQFTEVISRRAGNGLGTIRTSGSDPNPAQRADRANGRTACKTCGETAGASSPSPHDETFPEPSSKINAV